MRIRAADEDRSYESCLVDKWEIIEAHLRPNVWPDDLAIHWAMEFVTLSPFFIVVKRESEKKISFFVRTNLKK